MIGIDTHDNKKPPLQRGLFDFGID